MAQWCGKKGKCLYKTKGGQCKFIHYGCPYGPRPNKPKPGEYVEDIQAQEKADEK